MTISASYAPNLNAGNGVTRTFTVDFPFGAAGDLVVTLFDTVAEADVSPAPVLGGGGTYDYTVAGTPDPDTGIYPSGSVTFTTAPLATHIVARARSTPQVQETVLTDNGRFPAKSVEGSFDRQEMQLQERNDALGHALQFPGTEAAGGNILPPRGVRKGKLMRFDDISGAVGTTAMDADDLDELEENVEAAVAAAASVIAYADSAINPVVFANRFSPPHVLGTAEQITQQDIDNHPEWIGTYSVGTEKDNVCVQETFYACAARTSTAGHVIWNGVIGRRDLNLRGFFPVAAYRINREITLVGSGLLFEFASRLATSFNWYGDQNTAMLFTNSVAYTVFRNVTLAAQVPMDAPLWEMDWDGTFSVTKTQQNTLYDIVLQGNFLAKHGLRISHSGGGAQGDTVKLDNSFAAGFLEDWLALEGGNAVDVNVFLGDVQFCCQDGIRVTTGAVRTWGVHNENQGLESMFAFEPCYNQIINDGADVHIYGAPTGNGSSVEAMRSEGEIGVVSEGGAPPRVDDISMLAASIANFRATAYGKGALIGGTGVGTKYKTFIVVDNGSPLATDWQTPTAKNGMVYTYAGTPFSAGALVNKALVYRYNSGSIAKGIITANTTSTITVDTDFGALSAGNLTRIGGFSAGSTPSYDACPQGYSVKRGAVGQGFTTTANSTTISFGSEIAANMANGMYVVIPRAASVNPGVAGTRDWTCALIAKVTAYAGGGATTATIDRPAAFTRSDVFGYYGSPMTDGDLKVIEADFDFLVGVAAGLKIESRYGRTRSCADLTNVTTFRTPNDLFSRADNTRGLAFNLSSSPNLLIQAAPALTSGVVDLTGPMAAGDSYAVTVNGAITFNAPAPIAGVEQTFTLRLITNSTTSRKITLGTYIIALCPLYTTPVSGIEQCVILKSRGANWVEVYRSPQSFSYTPTVLGSGTAGAPTYSFQNGVCDLNGRAGKLTFAVRANTGLGGAAGNILFGASPVPFSTDAADRLSGYVSRDQNITYGSGLTRLTLEDNVDGVNIALVGCGSAASYANVAVSGWGASAIVGGVVNFRLPSS